MEKLRKGYPARSVKRWIALLMCLCLIGTTIPDISGGLDEVQAAAGNGTGSTPSVSAFATKTQLMDDTFAPGADGTAENYGKLVFGKKSDGTTAQEWYILGKDTGVSGDNTIIFAASPIAEKQPFEDTYKNKTEVSLWSDCDYSGKSITEVYPNHYGASDLRVALKNMAADEKYFTTAEQGLMKYTTVTTTDTKNDVDYTTTDKLYALQGDVTTGYFFAGTSDSTVLVRSSYARAIESNHDFWLRSPCNNSSMALEIYPSSYIGRDYIGYQYAVRPACNLNLSSVLFASSAKAASSDTAESGTIADGTAMTLRLDGKSQSALTGAGLKYNHGKITYTADSDITLMVQGRGSVDGGEKDWYYSVTGGADAQEISASDIASALSLDYTPNLNDCKIWVELTGDDGLTYAVMGEDSMPSVTAFATKTQLMDDTFAPNSKGYATTIGKLVFGKNSSSEAQEWYILGKDDGVSGDNTIIFATSPIATGQKFNSIVSNKTYSYEAGTGYGETAGNIEVKADHYGASELREALRNMAKNENYFNVAEQGLMNDTTVTTKDTKNELDYTTTDKLYALAADDYGQHDPNYDPDESFDPIKAGTNKQTVLARGSYWIGLEDEFWLRSPVGFSNKVLYVYSLFGVVYDVVNSYSGTGYAVQPASNLNLSSVLFASAAKAASSDTASGTIDGTAMTLRLDGKDKAIGTAYYDASKGVIVADRAAAAAGTVSLVVQGNDGTNDWYYCKAVDRKTQVTVEDIRNELSLAEEFSLLDCNIWVEATEDNMAYAKMAEEKTIILPSVTAFATPDELMTAFNPDSNGNAVKYGKLVFGKKSDGTTAQQWYILGKDTGVSGDNTIIFATGPMAKEQKFNSSTSNKTYNYGAGTGYEESAGTIEVYANHYGASDLRAALKSMAADTSCFTTAEQGLMNDTTVATKDTRNGKTYTTTDKLYALAADSFGSSVTTIKAGSGNSTVLAMSSYWSSGDWFWLRSPYDSIDYGALLAYPGHYVNCTSVYNGIAVQPASNLNLSSVLFASAATAASSDTVSAGAISSDTAMTLRLDGKDTAIGTAYYDVSKGVIVADRAAAAAGTVSLVVQGNDGTNDWYYSAPVGGTICVTTEQIKDKLSLSAVPDLADCNIWLETTIDNVAYAKMAETTETINIETVNSVTVTGMKPVACTAFNDTASCTDTGISTTAPDITYTTAGENGEEEVITGKADWNTTYKATVTLATEIEGDTIYVFDSSVSVTIDGETLTDALTLNADGTLTVTREFTTAKRKITDVTAPTVPATFTTYYGYEGYKDILSDGRNSELGTQATVTYEGTVEPTMEAVNVTWTIENSGGAAYDKTPGAENTFRWTIPASELTNYNAADCVNYDSSTKTITGTVTIKNKAAAPVTIKGTDSSIDYTGTTIDVSQYFNVDSNAGTKTYSLITGEGGGTGAGSLAGSILTVTKTGDFKIKVETAANGIYAAGDKTITLTVANGTIVYTATDYSGTYDGQAHGISANVESPEGTTITYSTDGVNYSSTNPSFKAAGEYTVYYRITKDNYDTIAGTKTVTISKKEITASVQAENKVYDGNVTATVTATAETGIAGETLTISGLTGSFADKNAGNNKTVTVDTSSVNVIGVEQGTSASNYSITYAQTVNASITPLTAQLSWGNSQFTYNGREQAPVATVRNLISGDECTVTVTGGRIDANEAGETYTAMASIDNNNYSIKEEHKTTEFTISNASQTAPSLTKVDESIKGKKDGKITGLTTDMEYRIVTQSEEGNGSTNPFTKVTDADMTFAPGTYEVRYAAKKNYNASDVTSVTISEGSMLQVTIPQTENQIGYSLSVSDGALAWQGSTTLTFALKTGYSKLNDFAVKAVYTSGENNGGNVAITDNNDGTYTISNVTGDVKVTVEGVADTVEAPTVNPVRIYYDILDGANSTREQNLDGSLSIRGSGEFSKFTGIKVDGIFVDAKNYTVTEGSTIITLKADYLNTISEGTHTFEIFWTDGSASTTFTIKEDTSDNDKKEEAPKTGEDIPKTGDDTPKTGDDTPSVWLFILVIISGTGLILTEKKRRKNLKTSEK